MSGCPVLDMTQSSSVAAALRMVDCRAGEAAGLAFTRLFGADGALLPALTILLTLYVAFLAVGMLTGRTTLGLSALTPRMMTLGLVLTFATSWVAYQSVVWNLAVGGPDQVAGIVMGAKGSATDLFASRVDILFNAIADAASAGGSAQPQAAAQAGAPVAAQAAGGSFTPTDLMWISALMLLLGTVGVLVTAKIALAALLGLGPIFIIFALFTGTRGLFEGWLKAVVMLAVTPLFAILLGAGVLELAVPIVRALNQGGQIEGRTVGALFVLASVYLALMVMALKAAGAIVAGWGLPGSAAREERGAATAAIAAATAGAAHPLNPATPAAVGGGDAARTRAIVAALPPAANDGTSGRGGAGEHRTRTIVTQSASTSFPAGSSGTLDRARGLGSRFRPAAAGSPPTGSSAIGSSKEKRP
ncbi:type IV secretion system protein [uncultured Sphingomonas sp.]|uniref:type IV secretion system protein n=1 Tax=uncultured Sphingomonas sp. TaxID=158754 RepID=UPI0025F2EB9D|nr:type IV secretion system protein [uncultured Sphingomonas sp.]